MDERERPKIGPSLVIPMQRVTPTDVRRFRAVVSAHAGVLGVSLAQLADLSVITTELLANAIRHGNGMAELVLWADTQDIFLQVSDGGPGASESELAHFLAGGTDGHALGLSMVAKLADSARVAKGNPGTTVTANLNRVPVDKPS